MTYDSTESNLLYFANFVNFVKSQFPKILNKSIFIFKTQTRKQALCLFSRFLIIKLVD
jgi:hypothetical protein